MSNDNTTECLLFPEIFSKPVVAQFDDEQGSSDGGAVLLKAAEGRYGLITGLAGCMVDPRQAGKVEHSLEELLAQRIFGIANGYADGNDAARLSSDPIYKLLLGRDPIMGLDLASQPTLSRFENAVGPRPLYRMGDTIAEAVLERHAQRLGGGVKRVTIDLDPTDDPTHGAQQLSFFNAHYDNWCFLPVLGFISFNDEAEQYLCAAVLRPGNAPASMGAMGILRRLFEKIRRHFSQARIRVRLDGGFAHPQLFDFLDASPKVEYVVAMAKNAVLKRKAKPAMGEARKLARRSQQTEHVYSQARYAAQSWPAQRRVIIKAEWVYSPGKEPKENPRFVVTNMEQSPQWIYEEVYCQRGDIENRIKELHELEIDRTSCSGFWANQFRVLLTAAAYVLMQEIRLNAVHTDCARAQVGTLRLRLLKLGARVVASVLRVAVHLPESFPFRSAFCNVALALGAADG